MSNKSFYRRSNSLFRATVLPLLSHLTLIARFGVQLSLFFALLALPNGVKADYEEVKLKTFAESKKWRSALFYSGSKSKPVSVVANSEFFAVGPIGRSDPLAELKALLTEFTKLESGPTAARLLACRYPYRYSLLKDEFNLPAINECEELKIWKEKFNPVQIHLSYASQYVSNPSSVFGHSFLLLSSKDKPEGLWPTINFSAAIPTSANVFQYAWGGITGWYQGDFSIMPFYQRIFLYGDVENRDLWIYPLRLSKPEFDSAINLLWELVHQARFTYYFFDENCAGELLRVFSAILPELEVDPNLPLYVHPLAIIHTLQKAHRLEEPRLISSQYSKTYRSYYGLSSQQKHQFKKMLRQTETQPETLDKKTLDALIEFTSYSAKRNLGETPSELKNVERTVYIQRSKILTDESSVETEKDPDLYLLAPHRSHGSRTFQYGTGTRNGQPMLSLLGRLAIHGSLDPRAGFLENSVFEFLKFELEIPLATQSLILNDLTLINVENRQKFWTEIPQFSWKIQFHQVRDQWSDQPKNNYFESRISGGISFDINLQQQVSLWANHIGSFGSAIPVADQMLGVSIDHFASLDRQKKLLSETQLSWTRNLYGNTQTEIKTFQFGLSFAIEENWQIRQSYQLQNLTPLSASFNRFEIGLRHFF